MARPHPARQREIVAPDPAFDARLDDDRVVGDGRRGGSQCELLSGVVSGVDPEESDEIAEPFDEGGLRIQWGARNQSQRRRCTVCTNRATGRSRHQITQPVAISPRRR